MRGEDPYGTRKKAGKRDGDAGSDSDSGESAASRK